MMAGSILKIKIKIPPPGINILARPSILERLEKNFTAEGHFLRQLTLVSAPAGFGKTTLIRRWLTSRENCTAWYSLDTGDNETERFWIYLISALQSVRDNLGRGTLEVLRSASLMSESLKVGNAFLTPLLNDLLALEEPLFLVLDDYQLINNTNIHQDMEFFVENMPPLLHLCVTTRSEPPWPLARWRARGKMAEVRQQDLQFSREEAGHFFGRIDGISLTESQLNTVHKKTEGWITGLQLAAFSLSSGMDSDILIQTFAGSHRHVFHFLSDEVFNRQPEGTRTFLLETAILRRFCPPLCEAVTGRDDSARILAGLERNNIFVIPLDEQGTWYRYHPLFADLLSVHLHKEQPGRVASLHLKAAAWFLENDEPAEALRHALESNDHVLPARILNAHFEEILLSEGPVLLDSCLDRLPATTLQKYPGLIVHRAWFTLVRKGKEEAGYYLEMIGDASHEKKSDREKYAPMLAAVKAYYHIFAHNLEEALENAEAALKLLPPHNIYWRSNVGIISGDARLFSGNPEGAYPFYLEAHRSNLKHNNLYLSLATGFKTATTLYFLGRLAESEQLTGEILQLAEKAGFARVPRVGLLMTLQGELLREKGKLEEAEHCINKGLSISEPEKPSLAWNYLFKAALAFSRQAHQDALAAVGEIEKLHLEVGMPGFITLPAAAWKARIFLELGNMSQSQEALMQAGISENKEMQGGQERGFLMLARLLPSAGGVAPKWSEGMLERIEKMARRGGHRRLLLETLLVKAVLAEKEGRPDAAEDYLVTALEEGSGAGYFQLFVDEGRETAPVYARLIDGLHKSTAKAAAYENYLRSIFRKIAPPADREGHLCNNPPGLVEELSARELEILHMLCQGLSNKEISQELFLSVGTVKWHTSNIYGKLGVRNRTEAVMLAQQLKL